ncbi:HAD family hydrolase [Bacillus sp. NPDC077027]|uniref:HAD family hydrolase n=1 Tax=Bacillus sp. NPDC077027 TaxID=3390548 RepID=UPI003D050BC9
MRQAFASDLDRTLIFSHRMLNQYVSQGTYELIEMLDGRALSYISTQTKKHLLTIHQAGWFIPVTTRTTAQYKRITFLQNELRPEFAVTTNGGCILQNGEPLKEWEALIDQRLAGCMPIREMLRAISELPVSRWVKRTRTADGRFLYLIMEDEHVPHIPLTELIKWGNERGWQVSLQGRKLYFIPQPLNKWTAVAYIKEQLQLDKVYSAGDSLLDYDLIQQADVGFAPAHGEVLEHHPSLRATTAFGMAAADEISTYVADQVAVARKS